MAVRLAERQGDICKPGTNFYWCGVGTGSIFHGCCSVDPCHPGGECPDDDAPQESTKATTTKATATKATATPTHNSSPTTPLATPTPSTQAATTAPTTSDSPKSSEGPNPDTSQSSSGTPGNPAPTPANSGSTSQGDVGGKPLSTPAVVGVSIGGTVGFIAVLLLLYFLIRRRKLSKRMSSHRDYAGDRYDEKLMMDDRPGPNETRHARDADVFAPFGGRANTVRAKDENHAIGDHKSKADESPRTGAGMGKTLTSPDIRVKPEHGSVKDRAHDPAQLDSSPVYIELDTVDTEKPPAELPSPSPLSATFRGRSYRSDSSGGASRLSQPSPMTPGSPIQRTFAPGSTAFRSEPADGTTAPSETSKNRREANLGTHRATLNATPAERKNNQHVTSWAHL